MPFNSYGFIFGFLPLTVAGFWILLHKTQFTYAQLWLVLASVVFYASTSLVSLAILAPSIALDYVAARLLLHLEESQRRLKAAIFAGAVILNILFLGYFKYRDFFLETANATFGTHFALTSLLLPLGISFLVFQKIAFLADVQSGEVKNIRLTEYLLFMLFFPRTIAGPIVHYREVMPQIAAAPSIRHWGSVAVGICLFSIGLFKKTVIADSLAPLVPSVFDPPADPAFADLPPTLLASWAAVLAYTFQLYFDFSGYSDMALGVARMLAVRLPMNFNSPFKASSLVEFWGRWHITLTRFLTTYIYTPLVMRLTRARIDRQKPVLKGKRSSAGAIAVLVALPTLVTMAISGLWHGAGWQFVVWGVMHGIGLTINQSWRLLRPRFWPDPVSYQRVMRPVGGILTFMFVVVAVVFFRSSGISSALSIVGGMLGLNGFLPHDVQLLQQTGVVLHWPLLKGLLLTSAFYWISVLVPAVILLPNSLELLRRFQPALDFPEDRQGPQIISPTRPVANPAGSGQLTFGQRLKLVPKAFAQLSMYGVSLSATTAVVTALLCLLGIMALSQGGGFVYGRY